jgi:hypothetical protein
LCIRNSIGTITGSASSRGKEEREREREKREREKRTREEKERRDRETSNKRERERLFLCLCCLTDSLLPLFSYFTHYSPQQVAKHVHAFIASKKVSQITNHIESLQFDFETPEGWFHLCPMLDSSVKEVEEKIAEHILAVREEKRREEGEKSREEKSRAEKRRDEQ